MEDDPMLADGDVTTLVAVRDLAEASAFYEQKLKLRRTDESAGWVQYRSGTSDIIIYVSDDAGSNKATTAAWTVTDVAETVRELKVNGVTSFQHYDDLPGATRDGDIHRAGPVKMAWFKDPSGNTFEVNGRG
jgi:catechol 2,3-dioxygenase-like lactoylglutathione lyase family enzyme